MKRGLIKLVSKGLIQGPKLQTPVSLFGNCYAGRTSV